MIEKQMFPIIYWFGLVCIWKCVMPQSFRKPINLQITTNIELENIGRSAGLLKKVLAIKSDMNDNNCYFTVCNEKTICNLVQNNQFRSSTPTQSTHLVRKSVNAGSS